jgi:hypothetical protein
MNINKATWYLKYLSVTSSHTPSGQRFQQGNFIQAISLPFCASVHRINDKVVHLHSSKANDNIYITWLCNKTNIKRNNNKLYLNKDLVRVLLRKISDIGDTNCTRDIMVTGCTRATITFSL